MVAAVKLLDRIGVDILEASAIIDLPDLGGSKLIKQAGVAVHTFCEFEGD